MKNVIATAFLIFCTAIVPGQVLKRIPNYDLNYIEILASYSYSKMYFNFGDHCPTDVTQIPFYVSCSKSSGGWISDFYTSDPAYSIKRKKKGKPLLSTDTL